jgi:outer membrane receptor protein involved in Fe transport
MRGSSAPHRLLVLLLILSGGMSAHAQSSGKIAGRVVDAETGDPLPGVNVYLEEDRQRGAVTDLQGRYFLLSVPPGRYALVMSFVGFTTLRQTDVEVFSGRTTTVDGALRVEVVEGEEIVVSAERPLVVRDRTSTVSFVNQEAIERLPVREVGDLVRYQPGVVTNAGGGFNFQGGRQRETGYTIDGIPVQNVFSQGGGNTVDVEVQSIQELQVFTGTFDAEFGGAQSGIVSVTTRDPGDRLEAGLRATGGGFLIGNDDRFIGGDSFDPIDSRDVSLTASGPLTRRLGFFFSGRYDDRAGALRGQRRFNSDDGFVIDTYRRWYRDVFQPDDTRLITLDTARTPTGEMILREDGTPLTFATGDGKVVKMDWSRTWTFNPKLVFRPTSRTRLSWAAFYNRSEGQGFSNSRRYAPDGRSRSFGTTWTHILAWQQTFGSNKVLNLRTSWKQADSESYAFAALDDPRLQYIAATDDVTGFSLGATDNGEGRSHEEQFIASGDFLWQIGRSNEVKTGFLVRAHHFVIEDRDRSWVYRDNPDSLFVTLSYPSAAAFETFEDYLDAVRAGLPILVPELARFAVDDRLDQSPLELAGYVQDKVEFDTRLVLKAGVRFEYFDIGEQRLLDPRTPTDRIGRADNFENTPPKFYVSPRLGLSYPISERGAFRVAYGHFVQMSAYQEMLKNPVFNGINVGRLEGRQVGNPDLKPERTIKYELGLQQELTGFLGLDVNLFYKNVRNLLGVEILGTLDNVLYTRTINRDYGLIKGATLALVTRPMGRLLGTSFDVTYSDARGSSSNPFDVANVVVAGRSGEVGDLFFERQIIPLDWDQTLTINLAATVGKADDWSVGFISQVASGQPYTPAFLDPSKDFPDNAFTNAERKPLLVTFDLNAEKRFRVGATAAGVRLQVNNVLNYLNERVVDSVSGRADQIVRLEAVQNDRNEVLDFVNLFTRKDDDTHPHWFSSPRQVLFSLFFNF